MQVIQVADYEEMSTKTAAFFYCSTKGRPNLHLGLATGSTPIGFYEKLVERLQANLVDVSHLRTFNLDEYIGLHHDHPQSYHTFMRNLFYQPLGLSKHQTFIPDGTAEDIEQECERYEQQIQELGGLHIQLLGVGKNGHIGFNEPGTPFDSRTHCVELKSSTREANARFFESMEDVPTHAITMGIGTILEAEKIVLLASGEEKAEAIYQLVHGTYSEKWPITALQKHKDVTVYLDEDAGKLL
ncbi:glucosamine-6-phosphate deaminase [Halobacillus yeomjeoni]|uniref:Glucosamine-6-phosphate deaminase n=1 Tax=Halobacillus yeomjeoni TaxID=311194 RepID=A0A931HWS2_9BACI|nr:glucosamine-6-phosphate deaminase [Halobacillus yeomjeoni]MBH0230796.1 glucosamine-6-phosphate deaminase [Halobacillus yeomjeoni]